MSKRTSLFLIPFLSLFLLGMRGCELVFDFFAVVAHQVGYRSVNLSGRTGAVSPDPVGVVVGDSGKIYTTRGRPPSPWVQRNSGTTQRLNCIAFDPFDTALVCVVGNGGTILRSTNAGVDWAQLSSGTTRNLNAISIPLYASIPSPMSAFVVGDSGLILWTTNSGNTWLPRTSGTTRRFRCVYVINEEIILAAGERGALLRTSNGGTTWTSRFFDTTKSFNRFAFAIGTSGGIMWVVGNAGAIYRSIDYGSTWTPQMSNTTRNLNDVYFTDGTTGAVVGDSGTVRNTTDGGVTWLTDPDLNSLTTEDIKSIAPIYYSTLQQQRAVDSVTVVGIVGSGVITISSEPLTQIEPVTSIPSVFTLKQNYPNPFNPTTTIQFTVKSQESISLKVYDLAGREIATLVNETLASGEYERSFDGTGLASGVYLYQLTAGGHTKVKKLVLLK